MRVYFDIFTQDELLSDSHPITMLFNDVIMEVPTEFRNVGGESYVESNAEEGEMADEAQRVLDLCDSFHLTPTAFTKKAYANRIKIYMQQVKKYLEENNPDRVQPFMQGASSFVKQVMTEFDEYEFYVNENFADEAMVVLARYHGEELTPKFYYIRDGLEERKY